MKPYHLSPAEAAILDAVNLTNQGAVMVQDLFYAKGNRRNLILERRVSRSANQNAERSRPRVTEAKQRAPITFRSRKDLNGLTCQRDESLRKFESGPKDFRRDQPARNLNLETRDRLIPLDSDDPVQKSDVKSGERCEVR